MTNQSNFIQVRELNAHYGDHHVLKDVSLSIDRGEILAVVGGSGCGKTTLFKHMVGLMRPTSGTVYYEGKDIFQLDEDEIATILRHIGIAYQSSGLFNSMTVGDNVALPLREHSTYDETMIRALVRLKLSLVGLGDIEDLMPAELSGGMRKRVGLARALALDPPILYLDEPSAGLDPVTAAGLDDLILNLRALLGITIVVITHELSSIRAIADRILMLDGGRVLFTGTVAEAESSSEPKVRQFFTRSAKEAAPEEHHA